MNSNASHLKIILSIFLKDIKQALVDRMTLGVIIGVMLLILPSQLIPLILQNENTPQAVVLANRTTSQIQELRALSDVSIYPVKSQDELQNALVSGRSLVIGLVFPDNFTLLDQDGENPVVDAYFPHWTSTDEKNSLITLFEEKINTIAGQPVQIRVIDDQVHPDQDSRGAEVMFILQMINAIMTISLVLVPQLLMSEKEKHTLEALLISPANYTDVVIGKGLTGVFYGSLGAGIVILMNQKIIAHWWVIILSAISGILFAVLLGLLIGLWFDNFQQATLSMSIIVISIMAPAFIKTILTVRLPTVVEFLVNWFPSGKLTDLITMSLMKSVPVPEFIIGISVIWGANLLIFFLCLWQIRRTQI